MSEQGLGWAFPGFTPPVFLSLVACFVASYKRGKKSYALLAIALFVVQTVVVASLPAPSHLPKINPNGFLPPDTIEGQAAVVKDETYMRVHLAGHAALAFALALATCSIPWTPPKVSKD